MLRYKATVIIRKAMSGLEMRYGIYNTFADAANAVRHVKSVNTIDEVFIEESYVAL